MIHSHCVSQLISECKIREDYIIAASKIPKIMSRMMIFIQSFKLFHFSTDADQLFCSVHEFQCLHSKKCIPMELRCDSSNDCGNGEDEMDCGKKAIKRASNLGIDIKVGWDTLQYLQCL